MITYSEEYAQLSWESTGRLAVSLLLAAVLMVSAFEVGYWGVRTLQLIGRAISQHRQYNVTPLVKP